MRGRFRLFLRGRTWYSEDAQTGRQKSLATADEAEARRLLDLKNESVRVPQFNLIMAKALLETTDPKLATRTWSDVMQALVTSVSSRPKQWEKPGN